MISVIEFEEQEGGVWLPFHRINVAITSCAGVLVL